MTETGKCEDRHGVKKIRGKKMKMEQERTRETKIKRETDQTQKKHIHWYSKAVSHAAHKKAELCFNSAPWSIN